jgi:predicted secreted protein
VYQERRIQYLGRVLRPPSQRSLVLRVSSDEPLGTRAAVRQGTMFNKSNIPVPSVSSLASFVSFASLAAAALFAVTVAGCAAESSGSASENAIGTQAQKQETAVVAPVTVDQNSNEQVVDVGAGQAIVLHLPSNATTGYEWVVTSEGAPFGEPSVSYHVEGEALGAGGTTTIVWMGTKDASPGRYPISLSYQRSWEPGAADTFSFIVEIVR